MRPRCFRIALLLVIACAGCGNAARPHATFKSMSVRDVTTTGFTMAFDVDVRNPNAYAIPVTGADYTLGIGGVRVLEGRGKPEGTLPANGSVAVSLPVTVTYDNLLAAGRGLRAGRGAVKYDFDGGIDIDAKAGPAAWFGSRRVPLKFSGELNLRALLQNPEVLLKSDAARRLLQRLVAGSLGT